MFFMQGADSSALIASAVLLGAASGRAGSKAGDLAFCDLKPPPRLDQPLNSSRPPVIQ